MTDIDGKDLGTKSGSVEWGDGLTIEAGILSQPMVVSPQKEASTVKFSIAEQQFDTKSENCKDSVGEWDRGRWEAGGLAAHKSASNREMDCRFKC